MALNLTYYGENDQNLFTLPDPADFDQGLIFGEKYFVLIGTIYPIFLDVILDLSLKKPETVLWTFKLYPK